MSIEDNSQNNVDKSYDVALRLIEKRAEEIIASGETINTEEAELLASAELNKEISTNYFNQARQVAEREKGEINLVDPNKFDYFMSVSGKFFSEKFATDPLFHFLHGELGALITYEYFNQYLRQSGFFSDEEIQNYMNIMPSSETAFEEMAYDTESSLPSRYVVEVKNKLELIKNLKAIMADRYEIMINMAKLLGRQFEFVVQSAGHIQPLSPRELIEIAQASNQSDTNNRLLKKLKEINQGVDVDHCAEHRVINKDAEAAFGSVGHSKVRYNFGLEEEIFQEILEARINKGIE